MPDLQDKTDRIIDNYQMTIKQKHNSKSPSGNILNSSGICEVFTDQTNVTSTI